MLISIYHNSRCSKSRKALEILKSKNKEINIIDYLQQGLTKDELKNICKKLNMKASELIRRKDLDSLDINLEDEAVCFTLLTDSPRLLERPIILQGERGIIARPAELLEEFLSE